MLKLGRLGLNVADTKKVFFVDFWWLTTWNGEGEERFNYFDQKLNSKIIANIWTVGNVLIRQILNEEAATP